MPNAGRRDAYQSRAWRTTIRRTVLERDAWRCRVCHRYGREVGGPVTLTVAHVIPERVRPDLAHVISNLRTLCRACHGREDGGRRYGRRILS